MCTLNHVGVQLQVSNYNVLLCNWIPAIGFLRYSHVYHNNYNFLKCDWQQIRLPLRGHPILFITRMLTDRIGLHSVLLPLLIA